MGDDFDDDDDALSIGCDTSELFEGDSGAEDLIPELNEKNSTIFKQTQTGKAVDTTKVSNLADNSGALVLSNKFTNGYNRNKVVKNPRWQERAQQPVMDLRLPQFAGSFYNNRDPLSLNNLNNRDAFSLNNFTNTQFNNYSGPLQVYGTQQFHNEQQQFYNCNQGFYNNVPYNYIPPLLDWKNSHNGRLDASLYSTALDPNSANWPAPPAPVLQQPSKSQALAVPLPETSLALGDIFQQPPPKGSIKSRLGSVCGFDKIAALNKMLDIKPKTPEAIPEPNLSVNTETSPPTPISTEAAPLNAEMGIDEIIPPETANTSCDLAAQEIIRLNDEWFHDFDLSDDEPLVKLQIAPPEPKPPAKPVENSPRCKLPKVLYSIRYPFGKSPEPRKRAKLKTNCGTDPECVVRVENLRPGETMRQLKDLWFHIAGIKDVKELSDTSAKISFSSKLAADLFYQVYAQYSYHGKQLILEREVITID